MKKTILIPDNINGITLGQYQRYIAVSEGIEGEFLNQRAIETLCNVSFGDVVNMAHKDVKEIIQKLTEILEDKSKFVNRFKISTEEFGFMPNLEEMTSGEFADLSAYIAKPEDMHKAMAVMFRPIVERQKEKYEILEYTGTKDFAEIMKFMPLGAALGAMFFFYDLAKDLSNATQHCIRQDLTKEDRAERETLLKSGDFIRISTLLQKEILQNSI
tara:strand:+ start:101 stop:745 length:645 start_codon:yes stop_codon:yes gene_type:complete